MKDFTRTVLFELGIFFNTYGVSAIVLILLSQLVDQGFLRTSAFLVGLTWFSIGVGATVYSIEKKVKRIDKK